MGNTIRAITTAKIVLSSAALESSGQKRQTEAVGRDEAVRGVDGDRGKSLPNIYAGTEEKLTGGPRKRRPEKEVCSRTLLTIMDTLVTTTRQLYMYYNTHSYNTQAENTRLIP